MGVCEQIKLPLTVSLISPSDTTDPILRFETAKTQTHQHTQTPHPHQNTPQRPKKPPGTLSPDKPNHNTKEESTAPYPPLNLILQILPHQLHHPRQYPVIPSLRMRIDHYLRRHRPRQ